MINGDAAIYTGATVRASKFLDNPDDRAAGLLALHTVAEAYGGLGAVAAESGISRESLYRAFSPKGNPTKNAAGRTEGCWEEALCGI